MWSHSQMLCSVSYQRKEYKRQRESGGGGGGGCMHGRWLHVHSIAAIFTTRLSLCLKSSDIWLLVLYRANSQMSHTSFPINTNTTSVDILCINALPKYYITKNKISLLQKIRKDSRLDLKSIWQNIVTILLTIWDNVCLFYFGGLFNHD